MTASGRAVGTTRPCASVSRPPAFPGCTLGHLLSIPPAPPCPVCRPSPGLQDLTCLLRNSFLDRLLASQQQGLPGSATRILVAPEHGLLGHGWLFPHHRIQTPKGHWVWKRQLVTRENYSFGEKKKPLLASRIGGGNSVCLGFLLPQQ